MTRDPSDTAHSRAISGEEALIAEFWAPLAAGFSGAFGLQDDCAVIAPPAGAELVVTTDAVIAGVHFFPDADPGAIAWKALAVNVSDLVAKGAAPLAYLMSVALPEAPHRAWLDKFTQGLRTAQDAFGCQLAGGDTDRTPGPLSVSITAFGVVPAGRMVRRATARPGDHVYVSGTIGDAALGLALRRDPVLGDRCKLDAAASGYLDGKFSRPHPPVALAPISAPAPRRRWTSPTASSRISTDYAVPPVSAGASRRCVCRCRMPRAPFSLLAVRRMSIF